MSKAITNAVENGVVFAVAAGNDGSSVGANQIKPYEPENPDISMVADPSLYDDALSVASVDNHKYPSTYLLVEGRKIPYQAPPGLDGSRLNGEYEYIDVGYGIINNKVNEYTGKDVRGKVAFARRGRGSFAVKAKAAIDNGAVTLIIYNDRPGRFAADPEGHKIPLMPISREDGAFMKEQIKTGKNKVTYPKGIDGFKADTANMLSVFSSWGPTPSLELKPEISAPGGNIYSLLNDNEYKYSSGTSMATPHVAGAMALLNQHIQKNLSTFKYNQVSLNTKRGMTTIPDRSFIIGNKAFDEKIRSTQFAHLLYDEMDGRSIIYKIGGKYFNQFGVISNYEMPADMVYYNALGEATEIVSNGGDGNGQILNGQLTKGDTARLAKVLLMNTAKPLKDQDENLFSPRKQGAGILQIASAMKTPAVLLDSTNNEPKVELKNMESTSFDLNLRVVNSSNRTLNYTVDTKVLRDIVKQESDGKFMSNGSSEEIESDIVAPEKVTVPANGFADFRITVDFTKSNPRRNMYVEGFVQLADEEGECATLTIPYMGFYGNYSEPSLFFEWHILGEGRTVQKINNPFNFGSWSLGDMSKILSEPGMTAYVSPKANKKLIGENLIVDTSSIKMYYGLRRNIALFQARLLDASGTEEIGRLYEEGATGKSFVHRFHSMSKALNGTLNGYPIPDGKYMYELRAKAVGVDGEPYGEWQSKMVPIVVDQTAPKVEINLQGTSVSV